MPQCLGGRDTGPGCVRTVPASGWKSPKWRSRDRRAIASPSGPNDGRLNRWRKPVGVRASGRRYARDGRGPHGMPAAGSRPCPGSCRGSTAGRAEPRPGPARQPSLPSATQSGCGGSLPGLVHTHPRERRRRHIVPRRGPGETVRRQRCSLGWHVARRWCAGGLRRQSATEAARGEARPRGRGLPGVQRIAGGHGQGEQPAALSLTVLSAHTTVSAANGPRCAQSA